MAQHSSNPFDDKTYNVSRHESGVLPEVITTSAPSEPDCYFTAKAVPMRTSTLGTGGAGAVGSPFSPNSPYNSMISPSQFPPPPGHNHPSFVFRDPGTDMFNSNSGRDSTMTLPTPSPSLFPQPPTMTGTATTQLQPIRPLFAASREQQTISVVSNASSLPPPPPPPKENPFLGASEQRERERPRSSKAWPLPAPLRLHRQTQQHEEEPLQLPGSGASPLLPPTSPISPHSPVSNPTLSPLTMQTLAHLSTTALRSPSLTFVEPDGGSGGHRPSSTSPGPLTAEQRERLWEMKRAHDLGEDYRGRRRSNWAATRRKGRGGGPGAKSTARTYLWIGLGLSLLALAGIVGLILALTLGRGES
ncbi:hypothetical protein JX266_010154 [Neoarthrinium moseri]|nr:hypothetical protein JX266_010154 [Neoarthrinium moseri]